MTVRYHVRQDACVPIMCASAKESNTPNLSVSRFRRAALTRPSAQLLVEAVSPVALEVALTVQQELQSRMEEADRLRRSRSNAPSTKRTWRAAAICASIPYVFFAVM